MKTIWKSTLIALVLFVFICMPLAAHAISYSFYKITNSINADVSSQLSVSVTDATDVNGSKVLFTFYNIGSIASSICDIYFDDGTLLAIASITNGSGVVFDTPAHPGDLPGGNSIAFETTDNFSADSDDPVQPNGVNPGESVGITFSLQGNQTYADTIAELNSGVLRIGLHVQAIGNTGGSDSYVNGGQKVPEPFTILLLGFGLVGLAGVGRKFKK